MPNPGVAVVRRYERGVVFRFGRLRGSREPGDRFMIPLADRMPRVRLRTGQLPHDRATAAEGLRRTPEPRTNSR